MDQKIDFSYEQKLWDQGMTHIFGVDEVGRGPWAGPVVAASVCFKPYFEADFLSMINDSKKLSKKKRELIYDQLIEQCDYGIGIASVDEIAEHNILQASLLAMMRAIENNPVPIEHALIDGKFSPKGLNVPSDNIVKGDQISLSIGAASIIAKITRDKIMSDLHTQYPNYAWDRNSGYGTKAHQAGLTEFGVNEHHRKSFKPIAALLEKS